MANCFIIANTFDGQVPTFALTDTKFYVPVVTLSTEDNAKLLHQLKPAFKRTINWNNYQSEVTIQAKTGYLGYLIDPSFQGVNRFFVLSFEEIKDYNVEIKEYNVMIDVQNFFDQPVKII